MSKEILSSVATQQEDGSLNVSFEVLGKQGSDRKWRHMGRHGKDTSPALKAIRKVREQLADVRDKIKAQRSKMRKLKTKAAKSKVKAGIERLNTTVDRLKAKIRSLTAAQRSAHRAQKKHGSYYVEAGKNGLVAWENEFLEQLLDAMDDNVPRGFRKSPTLHSRVEEIFQSIFDLASREKPVNRGTDGRSAKRPSIVGSIMVEALTSWQQNLMDALVDIIEDVVPGGLRGVQDKRTWFRVNKVMDLAVSYMKPTGRGSRSHVAMVTASVQELIASSMKIALVGWQQELLEGIMDLVDEIVPGGQMNAPRVWIRINEVMDLAFKIKPVKRAGVIVANTLRSAALILALTSWQQEFLEALVHLFEDVVGKNWQKQEDKIEEVFDVAFRMIADGDKFHATEDVQMIHPDEFELYRTHPNQHGPGTFRRMGG